MGHANEPLVYTHMRLCGAVTEYLTTILLILFLQYKCAYCSQFASFPVCVQFPNDLIYTANCVVDLYNRAACVRYCIPQYAGLNISSLMNELVCISKVWRVVFCYQLRPNFVLLLCTHIKNNRVLIVYIYVVLQNVFFWFDKMVYILE